MSIFGTLFVLRPDLVLIHQVTDDEVASGRELFDAGAGKIKPVSFISRSLGLGGRGGGVRLKLLKLFGGMVHFLTYWSQ